jgi:hypothetical protein
MTALPLEQALRQTSERVAQGESLAQIAKSGPRPMAPTKADRLQEAMSVVVDHLEKTLNVELADRVARDITQDLHLRGLLP